mmetsp:Transcript_7103/g.9827  ORF Transcript_7103/g.9827 Transcript_7103/m.9827 type:complete len:232 (-) Transcript_7103:496-1191(-)
MSTICWLFALACVPPLSLGLGLVMLMFTLTDDGRVSTPSSSASSMLLPPSSLPLVLLLLRGSLLRRWEAPDPPRLEALRPDASRSASSLAMSEVEDSRDFFKARAESLAAASCSLASFRSLRAPASSVSRLLSRVTSSTSRLYLARIADLVTRGVLSSLARLLALSSSASSSSSLSPKACCASSIWSSCTLNAMRCSTRNCRLKSRNSSLLGLLASSCRSCVAASLSRESC